MSRYHAVSRSDGILTEVVYMCADCGAGIISKYLHDLVHDEPAGTPPNVPDVDLRFVRSWVARHKGEQRTQGSLAHNPCDLCVVAGVLDKFLTAHDSQGTAHQSQEGEA